MDFKFTEQQEAWRQEVRGFLKRNPPENFPIQCPDDGFGCGAWSDEFGRLLGSQGWLTLAWPKKYGGKERPLMDVLILFEELAYARAPWGSVGMSWSMGNAILEKGSDVLKEELLPKVATGQITFWLAMSEPNAGSDLLGLTTTAIEKEDHFLVNGQKVWSTHAHLADYGELFVRTDIDPKIPRHKQISVLVLDKRLPGVTVRPLRNLLGETYHTEVFLDNVKVPKHCLLGIKNRGVHQMMEGLEFDRFWGRFVKAAYCRSLLEDLVKYVKQTRRDGKVLAEIPSVRYALADCAIEIETCNEIFWHAGSKIDRGIPLETESSVGKLLADEMSQRLFKNAVDVLGLYSQLGEDSKWAPLRAQMQLLYHRSRGFTIAGGTSEINRTTLATRGLGLPRN